MLTTRPADVEQKPVQQLDGRRLHEAGLTLVDEPFELTISLSDEPLERNGFLKSVVSERFENSRQHMPYLTPGLGLDRLLDLFADIDELGELRLRVIAANPAKQRSLEQWTQRAEPLSIELLARLCSRRGGRCGDESPLGPRAQEHERALRQVRAVRKLAQIVNQR